MTIQLVPATGTAGHVRTGGLRYLPVVAFGLDVVVVTLCVVLAIVGRESLWLGAPIEVGENVEVAGPLIIVVWVAAIFCFGGHRGHVFGAGTDEYKRVINASLATFAAVGIASYLARYELSRGFYLLAVLLGVPALVLGRLALRRSLQRARRAGALQHRVLIAGTEGHVDEIASVLKREPWLGYDVVGAVTPAQNGRSHTGFGIPVLGSSATIAATVEELEADVVFLAGGAFDTSVELRRLAWELEDQDVQVVIAPSVTDVSAERVSIRPVGGLPLIHLEKPRAQEAARRAKRTFDVLGSAALLVAFAPVFAFAALAVKLADRGPIFFRQVRVGRDGRSFDVWKFRTMVTDAEELLAELHAQQGYAEGLFKMEDDPRITRPGTWLRRFSVDELPQLLNVLKGDMSLVGPRPPLDHEVAQYDTDMAQRLRVRPGMTGLWQVSGRSDLSWSEAIRLDLYYVDNWSMVQDLTILGRTFSAVFRSRGAY